AWSRTGLNNMVPTGIVEVKVTKTNGQVINAIRKDSELTGHFYDKMNPAVRVTINQGEKVTAVKQMTEQEAAAERKAQQEATLEAAGKEEALAISKLEIDEAAKRADEHASKKAADRARALNRVKEFSKKTKEKFPSELHGISKDIELASYLDSMDMGYEVETALKQLGNVAEPRLGSFEALDAIRKRKGINEKTVSFHEIGLVIMGDKFSPDTFIASYEKNTGAMNIYEAEKTRADAIRAAMTGQPETVIQSAIEQMLMQNYGSNPVARTELDLVKESLKKGEEPTELKAKLKKQEEFGEAASNLLLYLPLLKPRERHEKGYKMQERERSISEDQKNAEELLDKIFPRDDYGPKMRVNLFRQVFNAKEDRSMNMELYYMEKGAKKSEYLGKKMSSAAAFQQILAEDKIKGKALGSKIDTGALISRLAELREKGAQFVINKKSVDKSLWKDVEGDPGEYIATHPLTTALLNNPDNLTKADIQLIQLGMAFDQGEELLAQKNEALERIKETHSEFTREIIDRLAASGGYTAQEIEEAADRVDEHFLFSAGFLHESLREQVFEKGLDGIRRKVSDETFKRFLAAFNKPINLGKGISLNLGLVYDKAMDGSKDVTITFGFKGKFETEKVSGSAYAGVGVTFGEGLIPEEVYAGLGVDGQYNIGKFGTWGIEGGLGAGLKVSPEMAFMGFMAHGGLVRNVENVIQKKETLLNDEQKEDVDSAVDGYMEKFRADLELAGESLTEAQLKEYEDHMKHEFKALMAEGVIQRMSPVQFNGIGLAALPLIKEGHVRLPLYLSFSIKEGKTHTMFARPQDDRDIVGQLELENAIKAVEGDTEFSTVYLSGDLALSETGKRTISDSITKQELLTGTILDKHNQDLAPHGLRLTPEGDKIRLDVTAVDGEVEIWTDPDSSLETFIENGKTYINLNQADKLSVRRLDSFSPYKRGEGLQNTKIYLSNNPRVGTKIIEEESSAFINYTEYKGAEKVARSKSEMVKLHAAGTDLGTEVAGTYETKQKMIQAGIELGTMPANIEDVTEARVKMAEALENNKPSPSITPQDRMHLKDLAGQFLAKYPLTYRQISVEMDAQTIQALVKRTFPGENWENSSKVTYMHQSLMVASLANQPGDFAEHILGWNKNALKRQLIDKNMPAEAADRISNTIMNFYADKAKRGELTEKTPIERGDILHIQVGTMGVEGYREAFYDPAEGFEMLGNVDLKTTANLEAMGLSPDDASLFIDAVTDRLSPLPDDPEGLFRSQLGLAVLDASFLIFGAEDTKTLAEMVKDPSKITANKQNQTLFNRFSNIVRSLRVSGGITLSSGLVLKVNTTAKSMGFYEKCDNFSLRMNEKLMIGFAPGTKVSGEIKEFIEGHTHIPFHEITLAVAVSARKRRRTIPEKETPPPPDHHIPRKPLAKPEITGHGWEEGLHNEGDTQTGESDDTGF
ncbi:hypothetical protein KKC94_00190, partial [Patescibacteria group bacterium]|nr:hypothetical protein [Patescibacteria group bacterium]